MVLGVVVKVLVVVAVELGVALVDLVLVLGVVEVVIVATSSESSTPGTFRYASLAFRLFLTCKFKVLFSESAEIF